MLNFRIFKFCFGRRQYRVGLCPELLRRWSHVALSTVNDAVRSIVAGFIYTIQWNCLITALSRCVVCTQPLCCKRKQSLRKLWSLPRSPKADLGKHLREESIYRLAGRFWFWVAPYRHPHSARKRKRKVQSVSIFSYSNVPRGMMIKSEFEESLFVIDARENMFSFMLVLYSQAMYVNCKVFFTQISTNYLYCTIV